MKVIKGLVKEDFNRDIFWVRIIFQNDDETKNTQVLACASQEYLGNLYNGQRLNQEHFDGWLQSVVEKWSKFEDDLFKKDRHYDAYANTEKGEANGIDFLLTKTN